MPAQWPQGLIPWLGQPKRFADYLALSPRFLCIYGKPKGRCLFCAAVENEESQTAAPRLSLCATYGTVCQLRAWHQDSCRRNAALAQMDFPNSRPGGGPVSGVLSPPWAETGCCAEMEPVSVRAARVGGRRLGTWLFPKAFPKGQRCVWWVHVWGPKGCWELLSRAISWQCPHSKDMTAPDKVGERETHWCNPAGPLALGMGYLG